LIPHSQTLARIILSRSALLVAVAVLASSTLSDPLQRLAQEGLAERARLQGYADTTSLQEQERLALLRRAAEDADAVRHFSAQELALLFGTPSLKRREGEVESWHFTARDCALDVYFPAGADHPRYAEYRVRGRAGDSGLEAGQRLDHKACVRSLFANARL
jgi:hypothetical protein